MPIKRKLLMGHMAPVTKIKESFKIAERQAGQPLALSPQSTYPPETRDSLGQQIPPANHAIWLRKLCVRLQATSGEKQSAGGNTMSLPPTKSKKRKEGA